VRFSPTGRQQCLCGRSRGGYGKRDKWGTASVDKTGRKRGKDMTDLQCSLLGETVRLKLSHGGRGKKEENGKTSQMQKEEGPWDNRLFKGGIN